MKVGNAFASIAFFPFASWSKSLFRLVLFLPVLFIPFSAHDSIRFGAATQMEKKRESKRNWSQYGLKKKSKCLHIHTH